MGTYLNPIPPAIAAYLLFTGGKTVSGGVSSLIVLVLILSSWRMGYWERRLARQRLYVRALHDGAFGENIQEAMRSEEAKQYWDFLDKGLRAKRIEPADEDIRDIPDDITRVNFYAFLCGVVMLAYACIEYFAG